jgi:cystathionine gamma-synthase
MSDGRAHLETRALHFGAPAPAVGAPVSQPVVAATSFYTTPGEVSFSAADMTDAAPYFYARWSNPTVALLEARIAALEGGAAAVCYASGMAAVAALFLSRLKAGDHLVLSDVCYAGVAELARDTLPRFGIDVTPIDTADQQAVAQAFRYGVTRLLHIETPANPTLKLSDIAALAVIAHKVGAELSVDSTIATPVSTELIALGADYVVHSLTKYICGHGDAMGGAIVVRDRERLADLRQGALVHHRRDRFPEFAFESGRGVFSVLSATSKKSASSRSVAPRRHSFNACSTYSAR